MYIYQVTHTPTRKHYYGVSLEPKSSFDPIRDPDPGDKFSNSPKTSVVREIITLCYSLQELKTKVTELKTMSLLDMLYIGYIHNDPTKKTVMETKLEALSEDAMIIKTDINSKAKKREINISDAIAQANNTGSIKQ